MYLDKLPAGLNKTDPQKGYTVDYSKGIPIGYQSTDSNEIFLFNHYTFHIYIHSTSDNNTFEIVGFNINILNTQKLEQGNVTFTYDVVFHPSNVQYSSRWDHYRHISGDIHWFGIIISNGILVIFSGAILHIFLRALKNDIDIYNTRVTDGEFIDEFGWRQVYNDVFRAPIYAMLLSSLFGTGVQLFAMVFFSLSFAVMGFLKPESRGSLLQMMLAVFVIMNIVSGYASARMYKFFHGRNWILNAILTGLLYPCLVISCFLVVNVLLHLESSSAKIAFSDILLLILAWLLCPSPLVLLGTFLGIKARTIDVPCKINPVPTYIPNTQWYMHTGYIVCMAGVIPFCAIFIELVYIMSSMWSHQIYFLAAFLYVSLLVLIIICAEISILLIYVYLCKGDYLWWWKSLLISGSPSIYVAGYSIYYFFTLKITRITTIVIYFFSMALLTSIVFLICGSIGLLLTFLFLRKIYSKIRVD